MLVEVLFWERTLYVIVCLEGAEDDVEEPESEEEHRADPLGHHRSSELRIPEHREEPPGHDDGECEDGADGVDQHTESQCPGGNQEAFRSLLE